MTTPTTPSNNASSASARTPKPKWLRVKLPTGKEYKEVREIVSEHKLHTICESGHCPNMGECWGAGTATFMILGNICTRSCGFCNVATGKPLEVDVFEPGRVAKSVKLMGIKHAVITSVDRDDLADGGSEIWAQTVRAIRQQSPGTTLETLIPDFAGKWENLMPIIQVAPEIVSHNLETVRRMTKEVRIQAKYDRSLEVLRRLRKTSRDGSSATLKLQPTLWSILLAFQKKPRNHQTVLGKSRKSFSVILRPEKLTRKVFAIFEVKWFESLPSKLLMDEQQITIGTRWAPTTSEVAHVPLRQ